MLRRIARDPNNKRLSRFEEARAREKAVAQFLSNRLMKINYGSAINEEACEHAAVLWNKIVELEKRRKA